MGKNIGVFTVTELSPGRWEVQNTINNVKHVTYGTESEVTEQLLLQTEIWREKIARIIGKKGKKGSAWRNRAGIPTCSPKRSVSSEG